MISLIIPVYNRAEKLKCCLASILEQTYKDIEVIVVNDGSTDESGEAAKEFSNLFKEKKIAYKIFEQENRGAPNARNRGFQAAKGEYVLFCDADVILEPDCLLEMLNALQNHPEASYAYSSFLLGDKLFRLQEFDRKKLRQMPYISTMSLIRSKHFPLTGWDEGLKRLQDWDLWLTMSDEGYSGIWLDKVLFRACPNGTISNWLPAFVYKFFPFLPAVKKYQAAVRAVKEKHGIILPLKNKKNAK